MKYLRAKMKAKGIITDVVSTITDLKVMKVDLNEKNTINGIKNIAYVSKSAEKEIRNPERNNSLSPFLVKSE